MSAYNYYNTLGNKVSTVSKINFCRVGGPMSKCTAASVGDQPGCTHHRLSNMKKHCFYYRPRYDGACDNFWAQRGVAMPVPEDKKDDADDGVTI